MEFTSAPVLAPSNEVGAIAVKKQQYELMHIDVAKQTMSKIIEETTAISHITWLDDEQLVYITACEGKKQVVIVNGNNKQQLTTCESDIERLYFYEGALWVQLQSGEIAQLNTETGELTVVLTGGDTLLAVGNTQFVVYRESEQTLYAVERVTKAFTAIASNCQHIQSAAFSMSGQYIGYVAADEAGGLAVYVYDQQMGIVQNMTEMFDAVVASDGQLAPAHIMWTETDAFYFVMSDSEELRLYYGDLYGSLLPASAEDERVRSYATARSGNWALLVLENEQDEIIFWDITVGEKRVIVE